MTDHDLAGKRILITGGAGFIGSHLVDAALAAGCARVVVYDALTYAANPESLRPALADPRCDLVEGDLLEGPKLRTLLAAERPQRVFHLAAETHVDRSIEAPLGFVRANVEGSASLLRAAVDHHRGLAGAEAGAFRIVHVSTDEVFGSMAPGAFADERSAYSPSSPYAASKAAADHLVHAFGRTYGLPCVLTWCTNNYGPRQFPEKLVPLALLRAKTGKAVPLYGDGSHERDWIHVADHCAALLAVGEAGTPGEGYCIGAGNLRSNRALVEELLSAAQTLGLCGAVGHEAVPDRPGHDARYALDARKLRATTGWRPQRSLAEGLQGTVRWYAENGDWVESSLVRAGYRGERLGLGPRGDHPVGEGRA